MKKIIVWLIIFLVIIINYKSGRTEKYTDVNRYRIHKKWMYLFFEDSYHPTIIDLNRVRSWEIERKENSQIKYDEKTKRWKNY
jgi:hypothetical protein